MKALLTLLLTAHAVFAALPDKEAQRMADAIKRIENSQRYPYGVKSITTTNAAHARKICVNSIKANWQRWEKAGKPGYFGDFMANRWVPESADPVGHKNWKRNFRRIVGEIKETK